ncbi:HK97-gp10 family putative phage morphogenesis protein [Citricoccus nitrophenolicus]|uniref:HK97-gp10 family putative phage morphogenesis protein n=1 Tax=Citricoccus nitrophenolicus TaxID=863575 RepID=A0ABV0IE79_9MICC
MGAGDEIRAHAGKLRAAPGKLRPLVVMATTKATIDTASGARELAPVDTGYLRASITVETGTDGSTIYGEVTAGANYARWVENGTPSGSHAPQPFMGPAREANKPKWLAAMAQLGGKAVQ